MFTKISTLTVVLLLVLCFSVDGQYRRYKSYEIHGGIGTANILGDLGGSADSDNLFGLKDIQFSQVRPTFYIGGRMDLNEQFSAKINLFASMISGSDNGSGNEVRDYTLSGWLFEASGQVEWNFIRASGCLGSMRSQKRGRLGASMMTRVYLFVGGGLVYSLPKIDTHGKELNPKEHTKSRAAGLAVPFGIGVRSDISSQWALGFELGRRFSTTDYIDGITTEWSKSNDTYYFTTLHLIYKIQFVGGRRGPVRPGRR